MCTLAIARNYVSATIPASFNSLTALQSLFLFSNKFNCNAPTLDNAAQLGVGKFDGIAYPATLRCYYVMATDTPIRLSTMSYSLYTKSYETFVPDVSNSVLIFTGHFATCCTRSKLTVALAFGRQQGTDDICWQSQRHVFSSKQLEI